MFLQISKPPHLTKNYLIQIFLWYFNIKILWCFRIDQIKRKQEAFVNRNSKDTGSLECRKWKQLGWAKARKKIRKDFKSHNFPVLRLHPSVLQASFREKPWHSKIVMMLNKGPRIQILSWMEQKFKRWQKFMGSFLQWA